MNWFKYTFTCDPEECDSMVTITVQDKFQWQVHSGKVRMECPCGRIMNWIDREDAGLVA